MKQIIDTVTGRREPRYTVREGRIVPVRVVWTDGEEPVVAEGSLIDLSRRGTLLSLAESPRAGGLVTFEIIVPEEDVHASLSGDVRWTEPAPGDRWRVGCDIDAELPMSVIQRLAEAGYLERRQDDRFSVRVPCQVKQEVGDGEEFSARLLDYSRGGFRLSLREPIDVGSRVVLRLAESDGETHVRGSVVWQQPQGKGFLMGCQFVNRDGYPTMWPIATQHEERRRALHRRGMQLSFWTWVGLLAVLLWRAMQ